MSLQNIICAISWNFVFFDIIFSVVNFPSHFKIDVLSQPLSRVAWINRITRHTLLPSPSLVLFMSQTLDLVQFALGFGGKNRSLDFLSA